MLLTPRKIRRKQRKEEKEGNKPCVLKKKIKQYRDNHPKKSVEKYTFSKLFTTKNQKISNRLQYIHDIIFCKL